MKKLILLTTLILTVTLTLGACVARQDEHEHTFEEGWTYNSTYHWHVANCEHTTEVRGMAPHNFSNNKCTVCDYEKNATSDPPTTPNTTEEIIAEYLLSLGDNFSVSAEIKNNFSEVLKGGQKYSFSVDANKIYANNNGEKYYVEEDQDGTAYYYVQENGEWHKKLVGEDFEYPTSVGDALTNILSNVSWTSYNEKTGVAKGFMKMDGKDLDIECSLNDGTVTIYSRQYIIGSMYLPVLVGEIEIHSIGTTTVNLPQNVIDDTEELE